MKFTKLAKSDKFEYMMLSRLIQDAKYFIDYPDLKHLWARTLDEHIKQMKEQYAKLDPKPEWISEEEINNLAKQMKESYTNHWNEVHPDNKIEASDNFKVGDKVFFDTLYEFQEDDLGFNYDRGILKEIKYWPSNNREYYIVQTNDGKLLQVGCVFHTEEEKDTFRNNWINPKFEKESAITQPNKPKPTTMLPDNMQWAWDPDAADWVAVLKDNTNTTPPLYDPNNQNAVNNTTTYMSNIKSASVIDCEEDEDPLSVKLSDLFLSDSSLADSYIKKEINCDDILNILGIEIKNENEYKEICNYVNEFINNNYMNNIKSSCLAKFLDGPQYSKEIKVEAGLIKEGLVKYAGFDFNRGTKYTITDKGLEVLRKASEKEHNEALNEREKLAYMFCFNTDEVSTLDTTGKVIKQSAKKWIICEADGSELGEVEADSELDAKVKFGIEHPEYADSQSICAKEIKAKKLPLYKQKDPYYSDEAQISLFKTSINDVKRNFEQIVGIPLKQFCLIYKENNNEEFKKIYDKITDYISKKYNYNVKSMQWFHSFCDMIEKQCNKIDAKYEETTESHEPYINPSETPNDHIVLENHDGWVNTASFEDDVRKQFQQPHQKLPNSDRDLTLLEKQILEITDEDTRDTVRKIFDEFQFSDKEAAEKRPYTEEEKRLLPLFKLVNEYVAKKQIQLTEDVQNEENTIATGQAEVINELEHKVKDLGFYCEPIAEITDNDGIGQDIYSLKIFTK